jgi:hypothetical protein
MLWRSLSKLVRQTGRKDNYISVLITLPVLDRNEIGAEGAGRLAQEAQTLPLIALVATAAGAFTCGVTSRTWSLGMWQQSRTGNTRAAWLRRCFMAAWRASFSFMAGLH